MKIAVNKGTEGLRDKGTKGQDDLQSPFTAIEPAADVLLRQIRSELDSAKVHLARVSILLEVLMRPQNRSTKDKTQEAKDGHAARASMRA